MIEFLNNTFGVKNEISVPILISLIVFLVGGLLSLIFNASLNYISRVQTRNSFRNIIDEVSQKCKLRTKQTFLFYPKMIIENNNDWAYKYTKIPYLSMVFQQNYNSIFNSFKIFFYFKNKKKIRLKAFNKTWIVLEDLNFLESRITLELEKFEQNFISHENDYNTHLSELRKQHDAFFLKFRGKKLNKSDFQENEFNFIQDQDKIWSNWQKIQMPSRLYKTIIYNNLIKPLYDLNLKNQEIPFALEQCNIILEVMHEYEQMSKILKVNNHIFYRHFISYKLAWLTLDKCLKILK